MRWDSDEQARQEGERRRRRDDRVKLGVALALTGGAVVLLGSLGKAPGPQSGWPASLPGLFWLVGVALLLGGVALAGWAVWKTENTRP